MPLLGNFAAQSNNRKKRDLPAASPVLCLSRLFNVVYLSSCSSIFACSKIDNNLVIVDLFDRCPRASNDDGRASSGRCVKRHLHVHRKFRQIERKERRKRVPWGVGLPFDVSWCCVTGFYRPELVESVNRSERTRGPWTREPVGGTVLFLESKDHGRLPLEKSYERDREKKMHGPLLILAFFSRGWGGGRDKRKLPKAAPGRSVFGSKSDRDDEKKKLRASCPALWMKFTTTKTRWQISPGLDLCPVKSSSLIQAQKGRKKRSLSCRGRAAKFPSCGIIS